MNRIVFLFLMFLAKEHRVEPFEVGWLNGKPVDTVVA